MGVGREPVIYTFHRWLSHTDALFLHNGIISRYNLKMGDKIIKPGNLWYLSKYHTRQTNEQIKAEVRKLQETRVTLIPGQ